MRYVAAQITGQNNTVPTSFQNAVMHDPMIISSSTNSCSDMVTAYQMIMNLDNKSILSNAVLLVQLKDNIKISTEQITSSIGKEFTYEKILYMACLPNTIFTGKILIVTDDGLPLDNIKLPCVSSEQTKYEWTAILDI